MTSHQRPPVTTVVTANSSAAAAATPGVRRPISVQLAPTSIVTYSR